MNSEDKITLELDRIDSETLQSIIGVVMEHGDAVQKRAAANLGGKISDAMMAQIPGLREGAIQAIADLEEEGAPDELITSLKEAIGEAVDEVIDATPLSEEEIDKSDLDETLDKILRESDPPEAS